MSNLLDITGEKYGRLTALRYMGKSKGRAALWEFRCECGSIKTIAAAHVKNRAIKSCGCLRRELAEGRPITHGMSGTPEYSIWNAMKNRCEKDSTHNHYRYGGRGISVCERWMKFENFYKDMGDRPEGMEIDRINNDGDYASENCRWTTRTENARNKSSTKLNTEAVKVIKYAIKYMGVTHKKLADLHNVRVGCINSIASGKNWKDVKIT